MINERWITLPELHEEGNEYLEAIVQWFDRWQGSQTPNVPIEYVIGNIASKTRVLKDSIGAYYSIDIFNLETDEYLEAVRVYSNNAFDNLGILEDVEFTAFDRAFLHKYSITV